MKLMVSDFDGTLSNENKEICIKDKEMMMALQQQGHMIAICTGRTLCEFEKCEESCQFPYDYLILNNGAKIVDKNHHILYEKTIDAAIAKDILTYSIHYLHMWSSYCDGQHIYAYKNGLTVDFVNDNQPVDIDFVHSFQENDTFEMVCFYQDNQQIDESKQCYDYVSTHYKNDVEAYFNTHFVDVVPPLCSKGQGIVELLNMIDEDIDKVYGIGDSYNDLSMFEQVDESYTFHHAEDDIKNQAKHHVRYVYEMIEDMLGVEKNELER